MRHIFQQADGQLVAEFNRVLNTSGPGSAEADIRGHFVAPNFVPHNFTFGLETTANDETLLDTTARSDGVGGIGSASAYWLTDSTGTQL